MIARRSALAILVGLAASAVAGRAVAATIGAGVTRFDRALDAFVDAGATVEVLGRGYGWAEGPVWLPAQQALLFADPPNNVVHRWTRTGGVTPVLSPSGLQTAIPAGVREAGANGLALDHRGRLVVADSGTRAIVRVDLRTKRRTVLADRFEGKRFNSPNDLVVTTSGEIYFTDPPYGFEKGDESPLRELAHNGVYRLAQDGKVTLLDGELHRPNGIALSPDGRTLYVALSDEARPEVLAYTLGPDGRPTGRRVFCDMRAEFARGWPGLPDGMDVDAAGRVLATGPGGVHVLAPDGGRLGLIATGKAVANCCIGEGGRSLFLTSHDTLARVALRG
jgi:gluconolactonase